MYGQPDNIVTFVLDTILNVLADANILAQFCPNHSEYLIDIYLIFHTRLSQI